MEDNKFRFKYLFDKRYDPDYVNGFYGGINPSGELVMHFYLERLPLPYEKELTFSEDGSTCESSVVSPQDYKFIRSVRNGVVMNQETARALLNWLQDVVTEMEAEDERD